MLTSVPAAECDDRDAIAARQSRRLEQLLAAIDGRNAFYTKKLKAAGIRTAGAAVSGRSRDDCRSRPRASSSPIRRRILPGARRSASRSSATRATPRPRRRPDIRCGGSTPTRAGSGCSSAGRRSIAPRGSDAGDRIFFAFSFGPFLGFWTAFDAAWQIGAHAIPAGGMSSQQRLAMIDAVAPTVVCCTPTYALRLAEVDGERTAGPPAAVRQHRPRGHRRRRAGRQHSGHARTHRARLGRARLRSARADRSRAGQLRVLGEPGRPSRERERVHLRGGRSRRRSSPSPTDSPASCC